MNDLIWAVFQPYVLLLMALAGLIFLAWRQRARTSFQLSLATVWLMAWLMGTPLVGRALHNAVLSFTPASAQMSNTSHPVLVLLTGGIREQTALGWLPTPNSVQRALLALEVYGQMGQRLPLVISGGYTHGPVNPSEARVLANFMGALRAERLPLLLEDTSLNTLESAREVRKLADTNGFNTVLLITDDLHMPRAMGVFKRVGLDVVGVPVLTQPVSRGLMDLWPGHRGLQFTHAAAYELYALAMYALSGYLG